MSANYPLKPPPSKITQTGPTIDPALLEPIRKKKLWRDRLANLVTLLMITLTLVMLGYVAYTLNNPVTLNLSRLLGR